MGTNDGSSEQDPEHSVDIPSFEIMKSEVTARQFKECYDQGGCTTEPLTGGFHNYGVAEYLEHPINGVSWYQAQEFCAWASGRLPSESEWEYAAKSCGTDNTYPWGEQSATCSYASMLNGDYGCNTGHTERVCRRQAGNTTQGLCDMGGSVWEWMDDCWHGSYSGAVDDGSAWQEDPLDAYSVQRGGSYCSTEVDLNTEYRISQPRSSQGDSRGIRCAKDGS